MNYLLNYLKNNAKFEAIKEEKVALDHFIGTVVSFDKTIITTKIFSDEKEYILEKGSIAELIIYTPKGVYAIECEVLKELNNGWELSFPLVARLSQRREHLRVNIQTPVKVKTLIDGEETIATTENVCAGGIAFIFKRPIKNGADIELEFEIEGRHINSRGKIVYGAPADNGLYRTGVIMTSLSSDDTIYIMDFCSKFIGHA